MLNSQSDKHATDSPSDEAKNPGDRDSWRDMLLCMDTWRDEIPVKWPQ